MVLLDNKKTFVGIKVKYNMFTKQCFFLGGEGGSLLD